MKTTSECIADEIMDTIERERRINRDDLILAVDNAIAKRERAAIKAHPLVAVPPVSPVLATGYGAVQINPDHRALTTVQGAHTHTIATTMPSVVTATTSFEKSAICPSICKKWMNS